MKLIENKHRLAILVVSIACLGVVGSYAVTEGTTTKTYEIRPQVLLNEQDKQANRALDAYERIMMRYVDLMDKSLAALDRDIQGMAYQLDSMEAQSTELLERVKRVEKALGIQEPQVAVETPDPVQTTSTENPNTPATAVQK